MTEPWMSDALCAQTDPDLFLPGVGGSTVAAKKICGRCEVREQCLNYALENYVIGVWGGLSDRERRVLRRARRNAA